VGSSRSNSQKNKIKKRKNQIEKEDVGDGMMDQRQTFLFPHSFIFLCPRIPPFPLYDIYPKTSHHSLVKERQAFLFPNMISSIHTQFIIQFIQCDKYSKDKFILFV